MSATACHHFEGLNDNFYKRRQKTLRNEQSCLYLDWVTVISPQNPTVGMHAENTVDSIQEPILERYSDMIRSLEYNSS